MHQIAFGGRAPPGPTGGAYSAPRPPSWIKGSLLVREGDEKGVDGGDGKKRGWEEEGGEGKGREGRGR